MLIHLLALGLWLGGIVFFLVVMGPASRDAEPRIAAAALDRARVGLETASWCCIGLLLLTGMFNLFTRVAKSGVPVDGSYGVLLAVKLLIFVAMVAHHCLQAFKHAPALSILTTQLPQALHSWPEPLLSHWRRWFLFLKINAALAPIAVLLGVALAKT